MCADELLIDQGQNFKGLDFANDQIVCCQGHGHRTQFPDHNGLDSDAARAYLGDAYEDFGDEIELVQVRAIAMSKRTLNLPRWVGLFWYRLAILALTKCLTVLST